MMRPRVNAFSIWILKRPVRSAGKISLASGVPCHHGHDRANLFLMCVSASGESGVTVPAAGNSRVYEASENLVHCG